MSYKTELPLWVTLWNENIKTGLTSMSRNELSAACKQAGILVPRARRRLDDYVQSLLEHFLCTVTTVRTLFQSLPKSILSHDALLEAFAHKVHTSIPMSGHSVSAIANSAFTKLYGLKVTAVFRTPCLSSLYTPHMNSDEMVDVFADSVSFIIHLISRLSRVYRTDVARLLSIRASEQWVDIKSDLYTGFTALWSYLMTISSDHLTHLILSFDPNQEPLTIDVDNLPYMYACLTLGTQFVDCFFSPEQNSWHPHARSRRVVHARRSHVSQNYNTQPAVLSEWPSTPSSALGRQCMKSYVEATVYALPPVCSVCDRRAQDLTYHTIHVDSTLQDLEVDLDVLKFSLDWLPAHAASDFVFPNQMLNGVMLNSAGITYNGHVAALQICHDCYAPLQRKKMPRHAWANHLYRGVLPDEFLDMTPVEFMACSIYRSTVHVTRLYGSASDESAPRVLHGNTCAHELNTVSTAEALPRTTADLNNLVSVVFIGPGNLRMKDLRGLFRMRRSKIAKLLTWAKSHNVEYMHLPIDEAALNAIPEDGILPGLEDRVLHNDTPSVTVLHDLETAALAPHPVQDVVNSLKPTDISEAILDVDSLVPITTGPSHEHANDSTDHNTETTETEPFVFIEKIGVTDPEAVHVSGHTFFSSALRNITLNDNRPDLVIHRASAALNEYENPRLFPGLFLGLYPYGTGGFDDPRRVVAISMQKHAECLLDASSRIFRYHDHFMFVVVNILNRRLAHLHTSFTVSRERFAKVAAVIADTKPEALLNAAETMSTDEALDPEKHKGALELIRNVNTVAARVPGSNAARIYARTGIRSYFHCFGMPHLFFTANPNVAHSPVFQVIFGDTTVDLTHMIPTMPSTSERARQLALDPVAAADFSIKAIFEHLFGWSWQDRCSKPQGGILGRLRAFFGTNELTGRANLHGHFLIWLEGGLNPSKLHAKMQVDDEFSSRFFKFFDSIIHTSIPSNGVDHSASAELRAQRPPVPPSEHDMQTDPSSSTTWTSQFQSDVELLGESLQRHTCRAVCHKYGNVDKCRFQFPCKRISVSHFDKDSNSVILKYDDGTVNNYNPHILADCRHNHDLRCILSGRGAKAAMYYISDYITKTDSTPAQTLTLL
jgi:hypothetical protein